MEGLGKGLQVLRLLALALALAWRWADALEERQLQALLQVVAGRQVPRGWPPCHGVRRQVALLGHHPLPATAGQHLVQHLVQLGVTVLEAGVVLAELAVVVGPEPVRG